MKLNFGCGKDIKPGYLNVDIVRLPGVDKVVDFEKFPYPFKDDVFDEVYINQVLEHLSNLVRVMEELRRICKNHAIIRVFVPHYNHLNAFKDPTHKLFFTPETFDYFTSEFNLNYYTKARFKVLKRKIIPSPIGRFIPTQRLLNILSMVFGQLAEEIYFELEVVK